MKKIIVIILGSVIYTQAHSQAWNLTGNAGTNSTSNFIGTTDARAFKIRTNNSNRITVSSSGLIGIGTTSPVSKLHVKGSTNATQLIIDASATQINTNPLIKLRKNDGTDLMHIHSDDSTNIFIGMNAGEMNDTVSLSWDGTRNTFIGCHVGAANFHGYQNTAVGSFALANNTNGSLNTAVGESALISNTTGWTNTAIGMSTMEYNTSGQGNTGCGFRALNQNTTGQFNTGIGYQALWYNNGDRNSGFGYEALLKNTSGAYNTACGYFSLHENTTGGVNTAYGHYSLYSNTTGNWNTAAGHQALYFNNGTANTAYGLNALYNNTVGGNNTAVGKDAMFYGATGSYNTIIGHNAGSKNGFNPSNFTAIGYNAGHLGNNSNTMEIGNASCSWIGGQSGWFLYSDKRIKDNIQNNVPGLSFITKLNPVTYNLNIHRQNEICGIKDTNKWEGKYDIEKITQTGFLAQEVERAAKEVNYDFNGVQAPKGNASLYSIQYASFVVPLVKAVQELNTELKAKNEKLESEIEMIKTVLSEEQQERLKGLHDEKFHGRGDSGVLLFQNSPNPFTEKTIIKFNIPATAQQSVIKIYTADGKELNTFNISSKGAGQIEITGTTLAPGNYNYTLFIDGKATDSKQMILTK